MHFWVIQRYFSCEFSLSHDRFWKAETHNVGINLMQSID